MDSGLDQLAHRARNLPEHAALEKLAERRTDIATQHGQTQTLVDDLAREQRKADADVEQVKTRRARNQERIEGGLVSDPKQLQAMQHENESLAKRIGDLEDEELEVMERLESAQAELANLAAELAEVEAQIAEQEAVRDEALVEVRAKTADATAERDLLAADIPDNLRALYDKLRAQFGGVGVGAVHQKRCGGCRLDIGAADLARMGAAPSDEVLRCEECNRILVRTSESGI